MRAAWVNISVMDNNVTKKRWVGYPVSGEVECPRADAFLRELKELCDKHKIYISHQDCHGGFILSADPDDTWIGEASLDPNMIQEP